MNKEDETCFVNKINIYYHHIKLGVINVISIWVH